MEHHHEFSAEEARAIGERIGIDWASSRFDVDQFRMGLGVELEHGRRDPATNVSDDDEITTGKIAWAHLNEFPDYYTRLAEMESEAERYWAEHGHRGDLVQTRNRRSTINIAPTPRPVPSAQASRACPVGVASS